MACPHKILAERRTGGAEAIDTKPSVERRGEAPVHGFAEGNHRRFDVGIADDRNERRPLLPLIVLIVDEARIVDMAAVDQRQIPIAREQEVPIGREMSHRACRGDRHHPHPGRNRQESQHRFGDTQAECEAAQHRDDREQPLPAPDHWTSRPPPPINSRAVKYP